MCILNSDILTKSRKSKTYGFLRENKLEYLNIYRSDVAKYAKTR